VSIFGVLPLCLIFREGGYQYLILLIVYNNIMDDLDGLLAAKLDIKSNFGGILDNVCDAIAHTLFVMVIGMHYGGVCGLFSLVAACALLLRVVSRIDPSAPTGTGSPTNELVRHLLFILLLAQIFSVSAAFFLSVTFVLHAVSMLVPYRMPYMIRSMTRSATAVGLVNVALVIAWLVPYTTPVIAACFMIPHIFSFIVGGSRWLRGMET
jgi:phosphatidylserine synthase